MDNANGQIRTNMGVLQSILIKHTLGLTLNIASSPPLNVFFVKMFWPAIHHSFVLYGI